jgi:hypothetical protein
MNRSLIYKAVIVICLAFCLIACNRSTLQKSSSEIDNIHVEEQIPESTEPEIIIHSNRHGDFSINLSGRGQVNIRSGTEVSSHILTEFPTDEYYRQFPEVYLTGQIFIVKRTRNDAPIVITGGEITHLRCWGNSITDIDLSRTQYLVYLNLTRNPDLQQIDISNNTSLEHIILSECGLTSIDLSKNVNLRNIALNDNKLENIDLQNNVRIIDLSIIENNLDSIDLTKNTNLKVLYLTNNKLSHIDLSRNTRLETLQLTHNEIEIIDLSRNVSLQKVYVDRNKLTNLDVSTLTELNHLDVSQNQFTDIGLTHLFETLPTETENAYRFILFVGNPGTDEVDVSMITGKKWRFESIADERARQ